MKHLIYGIILFGIFSVSLFIVMTVNSKMTRAEESNNALSVAVDDALENVMDKKIYTIDKEDDFVNDLLQTLLFQYENDSDLEIKTASINKDTGEIAIKVMEHYTNPNGKAGTYECERVAVLEKVIETDYYEIIFIDRNNILAQYTISSDKQLIIPEIADADFAGWSLNGVIYTDNELKNMGAGGLNDVTGLSIYELKATYN